LDQVQDMAITGLKGFLVGFMFCLVTIYLIPLDSLDIHRKIRSLEIKAHPKIVCMILTHPNNHQSKAIHVKDTWGSHCDKLIFMSTEEDAGLGAIKLDVKNGKGGLWDKVRLASKHVFDNHFDDFDWFMKADDDTFVIVENLKEMLSEYDTNNPIMFGHPLKALGGYFSGGAGYVLSKEALRRFVVQGIPNSSLCPKRYKECQEDCNVGNCMHQLNVTFGDSQDKKRQHRFFPFHPMEAFEELKLNAWATWDEKNGTTCCSSTPISFHRITPSMMYVLYYFVYNIKRVKSTKSLYMVEEVAGTETPKQSFTMYGR